MRQPSLREIGAKRGRTYVASQPVCMSYKLLEIERISFMGQQNVFWRAKPSVAICMRPPVQQTQGADVSPGEGEAHEGPGLHPSGLMQLSHA